MKIYCVAESRDTIYQGGAPYDGLYRKAPPEMGIFFRLQVYERVGISLVEVYKRVYKRVRGLTSRPLYEPPRINIC